MSKAKSLTEAQISQIQSWVDEGDGFSEVQRKLRDDLDLRVTYLETRFLLEDLKIELKPTPAPEPEVPADDAGGADGEVGAKTDPEGEDAGTAAKLTVDAVLRPGAIVSGKVDFGGGKVASWWLDQMGRLGMDMADPTFQPSEEQVISFQTQLRAVLQKGGF